jgi:hypothetical protein
MIEREELPAVRIGRNVRVLANDLEKWINGQRIERVGEMLPRFR